MQTPDAMGSATTSHQMVDATCADSMGATDANGVFDADVFRDEVMFHLGQTNPNDEANDVGFLGFTADRQPVIRRQPHFRS